MAEQENRIERDALVNAIRRAAQEPNGLEVKLSPEEELRLALTGDGQVTLFIAPRVQAAASAAAPPEVPAAQGAGSGKEVDKRVKLRGRVGTEPQYKPLPRRGLRVGFRFGEFMETESERPIWHDVYATGKFAEAIRTKGVAKGDELEVVGERQQAIRKLDNGFERTVERIYCYGVNVKKRARRRS